MLTAEDETVQAWIEGFRQGVVMNGRDKALLLLIKAACNFPAAAAALEIVSKDGQQ